MADETTPFKTVVGLTLVTTIEPGGTAFEPVRRLLYYSWKDIDFNYDKLTPQEKQAISKKDFDLLVPWVSSTWSG